MREYKDAITLTKNSRGIYSLDTVLGCGSGLKLHKNGCYNDCYAAKISRAYGYDFSKSVLRHFKSERHKAHIIKLIERIPLPFVRIGTMGDPSEDWQHTVNICRSISNVIQLSLYPISKQIVIITKHWQELTDNQLNEISKLNICINTSVSALDNESTLERSLKQFERVKPFCKSILRVVSCDFNLNNSEGHRLFKVQKKLFDYGGIIDTVFRPSKNNELVTSGVINIRKEIFNGKQRWASKLNRKTYMGKCSTCKEMCGASM